MKRGFMTETRKELNPESPSYKFGVQAVLLRVFTLEQFCAWSAEKEDYISEHVALDLFNRPAPWSIHTKLYVNQKLEFNVDPETRVQGVEVHILVFKDQKSKERFDRMAVSSQHQRVWNAYLSTISTDLPMEKGFPDEM